MCKYMIPEEKHSEKPAFELLNKNVENVENIRQKPTVRMCARARVQYINAHALVRGERICK